MKSFYDITDNVFFKEHFYEKYSLLSESIQDLSVRLVSSIQAHIFLVSTPYEKVRQQFEVCYPGAITSTLDM